MIPAPPGTLAIYESTADDRHHMDAKVVVAFDDDGDALVIGRSGLELARMIGGANYRFARIEEGDGDDPVGFVPGGGFEVHSINRGWVTPVVAWACNRFGGTALVSDGSGYLEPIKEARGTDRVEVVHPDEREPKSSAA